MEFGIHEGLRIEMIFFHIWMFHLISEFYSSYPGRRRVLIHDGTTRERFELSS